MKLAPFGRRSRAAAHETSALSPIEAALQPALEDGRWHIPDRFNFTGDVIEVLAEDPKRRALMHLGAEGVIEPHSFHQLAESASRWAAQFRAHEVRHGDRVLVLVASKLHWIEVMLAGIKAGVVTVPCPQTLSAAALDIRVASTGAKLVVATRAMEAEMVESADRPTVLYVEDQDDLPVRHLGEEPSADTSTRDLAFVLSTSGAAYGPHGVTHTHAAVFAARAEAEHWLDAGSHDVVWCTSDTGSALTVWNVLLGPWSRGAEIVCHDGPFDPEERLDLIRRLDVTVLCQSPLEYQALADLGEDVLRRHQPPVLRRMVSTGDSLSPEVAATFESAWGIAVHDGYGQVECGTVVGYTGDAAPKPGSIGLPLPGHDVVVVDVNGNELPPGADGDLVVRGESPMLFSGYWQAPDETKSAYRGDMYVTGDIATRDEDGYIHLLGRSQDVITSGGNRFSPADVEDALRGYDVVVDAGVVGSRDLERGGQFVRAFVVLRPDVQGSDRLVAEIRQHLRKSLPESKVPREVEFVDVLPRTPNGKLRRLELRERPVVRVQPAWTEDQPRAWKPQPEIAPEPEPVVVEDPGRGRGGAAPGLRGSTLADARGTTGERASRGRRVRGRVRRGRAARLHRGSRRAAAGLRRLLPQVRAAARDRASPADPAPRTGLPKLIPDGKFEMKPEPSSTRDHTPFPGSTWSRSSSPSRTTLSPKRDDPLAPPKKPAYTVIPRPIDELHPYSTRVNEPPPSTPPVKPEPRAGARLRPPEPEQVAAPEPEPEPKATPTAAKAAAATAGTGAGTVAGTASRAEVQAGRTKGEAGCEGQAGGAQAAASQGPAAAGCGEGGDTEACCKARAPEAGAAEAGSEDRATTSCAEAGGQVEADSEAPAQADSQADSQACGEGGGQAGSEAEGSAKAESGPEATAQAPAGYADTSARPDPRRPEAGTRRRIEVSGTRCRRGRQARPSRAQAQEDRRARRRVQAVAGPEVVSRSWDGRAGRHVHAGPVVAPQRVQRLARRPHCVPGTPARGSGRERRPRPRVELELEPKPDYLK